MIACGGKEQASPPAAQTPPAPAPSAATKAPASVRYGHSDCAPGVPTLRAEVQRGVCYAHNYQHGGTRGYGSAKSRETMQALKALGVTWLSLTPFGFSASLQSTEVRLPSGMAAAETDARMEAELQAASEVGLSVLLKPHVWIQRGEYRGELAPSDWDAWFESYTRFILHYAEMAQRHDVPILAVGVEWKSSSKRFVAKWRQVIARVRQVYTGKLVYAANWDEAPDVGFWDAVDYIGVQFYPPLAESERSTDSDKDAALAAQLDGLAELSRTTGRPVLLTEVGYKSVSHTELAPHQWPERMRGTPTPDPAAQAIAYERLLGASATRDWLQGIYLWKWFTDPSIREEGPTGFSPCGKPAEAVVRASYAGCDREPEAPNPPMGATSAD